MPKKDCSELAKAILNLAMNIAADPEVCDIDDVVWEIQKSFPVMPRNEIINAIVDASSSEAKEVDELAKKLSRIKREAKTDESLRDKIQKFEDSLKEGELPEEPEPRKLGPATIEKYRATAKNLRKWLETADPNMRQTLQERLDVLDKQIETGEFVIDRAKETQLHESLQSLQDQIKIAQQQVKDAKVVKKVMDEINALQAHLDAGTLPTAKQRRPLGPTPIDTLRDIRDDLRKKLSQSEPAQKKKLENTIAVLEARIKAGDFAPHRKLAPLPQSKEIEHLIYQRNRLRRDIRVAVMELKPKTIWSHIAEPFNAVRAVMTSWDVSAVLRQGGFIVFAHPIRALETLPNMFSALVSEEASSRINGEILDRDNAPMYDKAKLYIAPIDGTERLTRMEETFMSKWAERIPGVRASERAYLTFLNRLRADSFDTMAATLSKGGTVNLDEAKAIARFINEATGRGGMGIEQAAVGLNVVFFAPKYTISRFQLLLGHPLWGGTNATRKLIAIEYARYLIGVGTVLALGHFAGGDLELDPRSSDFLKLKFGNTRIDMLSGLSQITVLLSKLALRERKTTGTGKIVPLAGEDVPYGGQDIPSLVSTFLRTKLSPTFGIPLDVISGENVVGEKVTPSSALFRAPFPLAFRDIYETMVEQGIPAGTVMGILSLFGAGLQTYEEKTKSSPRRKQG